MKKMNRSEILGITIINACDLLSSKDYFVGVFHDYKDGPVHWQHLDKVERRDIIKQFLFLISSVVFCGSKDMAWSLT